MTFIFVGWPRKTLGHLFCTTSSFCASFQIHWWIQTAVTVQKCSIWVKIGDFLSSVLCDLEIWWMTLTNNRAPLLCYFKLCKLFQSQLNSKTAQFRSKSATFVPCHLENSWMTLKTIGHLFYATSRFQHHFIAICEFELEFQSEKSQFGVKIDIF